MRTQELMQYASVETKQDTGGGRGSDNAAEKSHGRGS